MTVCHFLTKVFTVTVSCLTMTIDDKSLCIYVTTHYDVSMTPCHFETESLYDSMSQYHYDIIPLFTVTEC